LPPAEAKVVLIAHQVWAHGRHGLWSNHPAIQGISPRGWRRRRDSRRGSPAWRPRSHLLTRRALSERRLPGLKTEPAQRHDRPRNAGASWWQSSSDNLAGAYWRVTSSGWLVGGSFIQPGEVFMFMRL